MWKLLCVIHTYHDIFSLEKIKKMYTKLCNKTKFSIDRNATILISYLCTMTVVKVNYKTIRKEKGINSFFNVISLYKSEYLGVVEDCEMHTL